jgi:hypothetical protein
MNNICIYIHTHSESILHILVGKYAGHICNASGWAWFSLVATKLPWHVGQGLWAPSPCEDHGSGAAPMQLSIEIIHPCHHFRSHHLRTPIIDVVANDPTIGREPTRRSTQKHSHFPWCCRLWSSEDHPCVDDVSTSLFSTRCNWRQRGLLPSPPWHHLWARRIGETLDLYIKSSPDWLLWHVVISTSFTSCCNVACILFAISLNV